MKSHVLIARRYAKGLLKSIDEIDLDHIEESLGDFAHAYDQDLASISKLFVDPAFTVPERCAVVDGLAKQAAMHPLLHQFLLLLVMKDRMTLIHEIYQAARLIIDERRGRVRALVVTATPIDEAHLEGIREALRARFGRQIFLETAIDEQLLGGIRVEVLGAVFDGTLRAKLDGIKHALMGQFGH